MIVKPRIILAGLLLATAGLMAMVRQTNGSIRIFTPDTITVGVKAKISAPAYDAKNRHLTSAYITWTVGSPGATPTAPSATFDPDGRTHGQTGYIIGKTPTPDVLVTATWADPKTGSVIASLSRHVVVLAVPVITHVSIYGRITYDSTTGMSIDSTSFTHMTVGDTLKTCLYAVGYTADGHIVTGKKVTWSSTNTKIAKFVPVPGANCPDTTVNPLIVGKQTSMAMKKPILKIKKA